MIIGITGATGYVGAKLAAALREAGHTVIKLMRSPGEDDRPFELGKPVESATLQGLDVLVHCAWDMRLSNPTDVQRVNVKGSLLLMDAAKAASVSRVVFISSMSAFADCQSVYGKAKREVEARVAQLGGISIRPGLVYGPAPGGVTGALLGLARHTSILPMVGSGNFRLHTCHEEDLARLVSYCCSTGAAEQLPNLITAAEPQGCAFRDIVSRLAQRKLYYLPVPWRLIWGVLRSLEGLGVQPRLKSDSLIGLVRSDPNPDFSVLQQTGIRFRQLPELPSAT